MSADDGHMRNNIGSVAAKIRTEFNLDMFVAIGGGGFIPARILRTFLKTPQHKNIPIQAIGLALYEEFGSNETNGGTTTAEKLGKEVIRTQWLDFSTLGHTPLLGRKILIVDEVDDTRTTLGYAVSELEKDVTAQLEKLTPEQRASIPPTEFAIFVVHNKLKPKHATLPDRIKYYSGEDIEDLWVEYPWEQLDIHAHDKLAAETKALAGQTA